MPAHDHNPPSQQSDRHTIPSEPSSELELKPQSGHDSQHLDYDTEDEDPWTSTCICGLSTPPLYPNGTESPSIMCDVCSGATEHWQHNVCMGLPLLEEDLPEHYVCHLCIEEDVALREVRGEGIRSTPMSGWHEEIRRALARGESIWERRVDAWRRRVDGEMVVRGGVIGEVEVLGDPGVARVKVKKRVKLRIWVRPREEKELEKVTAPVKRVESTGKTPPKTAVGKGAKRKAKDKVKLPVKVTKKAAIEKSVTETKEKPKNRPPRKKAKHHDGKAY